MWGVVDVWQSRCYENVSFIGERKLPIRIVWNFLRIELSQCLRGNFGFGLVCLFGEGKDIL
jgi:hypothetical protein